MNIISREERNKIFLDFKKNNRSFYYYIINKENVAPDDEDEAIQIIDETILKMIPVWKNKPSEPLGRYTIKSCRDAVRVIKFSKNSIAIPTSFAKYAYCYYKKSPLNEREKATKKNMDIYMQLQFLQVSDRDIDNKYYNSDIEDKVDKKIFQKRFHKVYNRLNLSPKQRRIINKHYFDNISYTEMVSTEDGTPQNICSVAKTAFKKIRRNNRLKELLKELV